MARTTPGVILRIEAPHFCAALKIKDGWCAPIIGYMRWWTKEQIEVYCRKKGWTVTTVAS